MIKKNVANKRRICFKELNGSPKTSTFLLTRLADGVFARSGKHGGKGKGKAIPLQAWTGPKGSRRLRLPYFKT
jgi:hypothetical protein